MAGISYKALKTQYAENKLRYNGKELQDKEFSDGTGLEEYDFGQRMQDPQLVHFWQQDRFADKYADLSPYQYAAGNPIKYIDKNGDSLIVTGKDAAVQGIQKIVNDGLGGYYTVQQNESGTSSLVSTGKDGEMNEQACIPGGLLRSVGRFEECLCQICAFQGR